MKQSFLFYHSYRTPLEMLTDDERGKLLIAVIDYSEKSIIPDLPPAPQMAFAFIKQQMDMDLEKYEEKVRKNQENGKKGGRPKNPTVPEETERFPEEPKKPDNGNVDDKEDVKDKKHIVQEAQDLFEQLWKLYPLKRGKGQVSDANKRQLLDIGFDEMARTIKRYKADLARDDWREPQNGSTFFNSGYKDYLDGDYVAPPAGSKASKQNSFNNFTQRTYDFNNLENQLLKKQLEDRQERKINNEKV